MKLTPAKITIAYAFAFLLCITIVTYCTPKAAPTEIVLGQWAIFSCKPALSEIGPREYYCDFPFALKQRPVKSDETECVISQVGGEPQPLTYEIYPDALEVRMFRPARTFKVLCIPTPE